MADKQTTILVIDDEEPIRQSFADYLEDLDYRVLTAENGRIGLEIFNRDEIDLVLVDLRMPEMDGLEVLDHITGEKPETPLIVVSGTGVISDAIEALHKGAWDYLLKPIRRERLEEALNKAQKINRAQLLELGKQEQSNQARSHISAYMGGNLQLVPSENIYYFQAEQKYVSVHHTEGQLLIDDSLKSLEDEYGERFLRVHRNSLVALDYVEGLEKDAEGKYQIRFRNIDNRIEVSRRMVAATRRRLKEMGKA